MPIEIVDVDAAPPDVESLVVLAQAATSSWERDRLEGDIVVQCRSMTWGLAHRYANRGAEIEDLRAVAEAALLGAIRRFDAERGRFMSYATITILGEIKRYFRDCCWTIRPTRQVQELQPRLAEAVAELQQAGETESAAGIARHLDLPIDVVKEASAARTCFSPSPLDAPAPGSSAPRSETLAVDEEGFSLVEDRLAAAAACVDLTDDERELLRLRFVEELTQRQIAELTGSSQMNVSRSLRRLLNRLRADLVDPRELETVHTQKGRAPTLTD